MFVYYVRVCGGTYKKWILQIGSESLGMNWYGTGECCMMIPGTFEQMRKDYE